MSIDWLSEEKHNLYKEDFNYMTKKQKKKKIVKKKKKSILCKIGFHKWYKGDEKGGVFCENECYKCGKVKNVSL